MASWLGKGGSPVESSPSKSIGRTTLFCVGSKRNGYRRSSWATVETSRASRPGSALSGSIGISRRSLVYCESRAARSIFSIALQYFQGYDSSMASKIMRDGNGLLFCAKCGGTRSKLGVLWRNENAVLAHLKHCRGQAGLAQERQEIRAKLAAVPIVTPDRALQQPAIPAIHARPPAAASQEPSAIAAIPAGIPAARTQDFPQAEARMSGSVRAAETAIPPRSAYQPAGMMPAASALQGFVTQAEYDRLYDDYNLTLIERDEALQLAETSISHNENHTPHLALAQAQQDSSSWLPWALGIGVVSLIVYGVASASDEQPEPSPRPGPSMRGRGSAKGSAPGVGALLDLGSKGLNFFSKARGAFKI